MNPDLRARFLSGVAALLVILPILVLGNFWAVAALAFVAAAWGMHEMVTMGLREQRASAFPLLLLLGAPLFALAALSTSLTLPGTSIALPDRSLLLLAALVLTVQGSAIYFLFTAETTEGLGDRWARFLLAALYVPLLLGLLPAIFALDGGRSWVWVALGVGWLGDIGGYFAGRAFGKHKMFPLISPKKTWEGFAGGVALAIVGLGLLKLIFFDRFATDTSSITWLDCLVLGIVGDVAGVVGDFVESMLKRSYGAKDSGRFLPGHGGMLDRIDAVMFAVPVVYVWLVVLRPLVLP